MRNVARLDFSWLHVPKFLDAEAVDLRVDVVELLLGYELLGQRAAWAFGDDGDFCAQFVSGRKVGFWLAILVEPLVFCDDAGNALTFVNQIGAAEFLENIDAEGFHEVAE